MKFSQFSQKDLEQILEFTRFVAAQQTDDESAKEAELSARKYAEKRNNKKHFSSDFGFSDEDKTVVQQTKDWIRRQYLRGHGKRDDK